MVAHTARRARGLEAAGAFPAALAACTAALGSRKAAADTPTRAARVGSCVVSLMAFHGGSFLWRCFRSK